MLTEICRILELSQQGRAGHRTEEGDQSNFRCLAGEEMDKMNIKSQL